MSDEATRPPPCDPAQSADVQNLQTSAQWVALDHDAQVWPQMMPARQLQENLSLPGPQQIDAASGPAASSPVDGTHSPGTAARDGHASRSPSARPLSRHSQPFITLGGKSPIVGQGTVQPPSLQTFIDSFKLPLRLHSSSRRHNDATPAGTPRLSHVAAIVSPGSRLCATRTPRFRRRGS